MPKGEAALREIIERIRSAPPGEADALLREAARLALDIPPRLPRAFAKSAYTAYGDTDILLRELPTRLKAMYNEAKTRIYAFTADISTARMAYETVHPAFPASLRSALRDRSPNAEEARAVFVYIPPYERADYALRAKSAVLLNPGRFSSLQLRAAAEQLSPECAALLLDASGLPWEALPGVIRGNDADELDYLIARRDIASGDEEKYRQLQYILSFLEAMMGRVEHGKE